MGNWRLWNKGHEYIEEFEGKGKKQAKRATTRMERAEGKQIIQEELDEMNEEDQ